MRLTFQALWERLRGEDARHKEETSWSENRRSLTVRTGMENFGLEPIYAAGVNMLGLYQKELAKLIKCRLHRLCAMRSKVIRPAHG